MTTRLYIKGKHRSGKTKSAKSELVAFDFDNCFIFGRHSEYKLPGAFANKKNMKFFSQEQIELSQVLFDMKEIAAEVKKETSTRSPLNEKSILVIDQFLNESDIPILEDMINVVQEYNMSVIITQQSPEIENIVRPLCDLEKEIII